MAGSPSSFPGRTLGRTQASGFSWIIILSKVELAEGPEHIIPPPQLVLGNIFRHIEVLTFFLGLPGC